MLTSSAAALAGHLAARLRDRPSALVAAYVPVGSEPGGAALLTALAEAGARVLLPVVLPSFALDWAPHTDAASLLVTSRGLLEPAGTRLGPSAITACDLVLVPALAADLRGNRLGRGAGCYDRALALVPPGVPIVALLHDGELVPSLPAEPHDVPVTAAITPGEGWCDLAPV